MKKLLVLLCLLVFSSVSFASGSVLNKNECVSYGATAANMHVLVEQGATLSDIKALMDNESFNYLPQDIQTLLVTTAKFLIILPQSDSPEVTYIGATEFCLAGGGDVEKMTLILEKTMGTEI